MAVPVGLWITRFLSWWEPYCEPMTVEAIPGYLVTGLAGYGAGGTALQVLSTAGDRGVAVIADQIDSVRIALLREISHPSLPAVQDVVALESSKTAVIFAEITGPSLATVVNARSVLHAGEAATLLESLAGALHALHQAGLVHGDVSPANILISPVGPVLIDLVGHGGLELGHQGHIAPEVLGGARPTAASDVWALARAVAWACNDGEDVIAALGSALADDPEQRPTAMELVQWALSIGTPEPVEVPGPGALACAQVRAGAEPTLLRPKAHRVGWRNPLVILGSLSSLALAAAGVWWFFPPPVSAPTALEANVIIHELLAGRDRAIGALDATALLSVYRPESSPLEVDQQLIASLTAGGVQLTGFESQLSDLKLGEISIDGISAEALVGAGEYRSVVDGEVSVVAASEPRCVALELTKQDGRWLIADITACSPKTKTGGG